MKKLFLSTIKLFIMTMLITGTVNAQKAPDPLSPARTQTSQDVVSNSGNSHEVKTGNSAAPELGPIFFKDFKRRYNDVNDATWNVAKFVMVASFIRDGIQTSVVYLKSGRYLHSLLTYDVAHLDTDIKSAITRKFKGFDITWVTEVHENDKVFYFVNIETDKKFKQVYVYDGEIYIYKEFKKTL